jgi:hypothetical protein
VGPTPRHTVWINTVPEPVTVKQRMHLDVCAGSVDEVVALGGVVVDADSFGWTVVRDVEGGELCVFDIRADRPAGLAEIVVDTSDAVGISTWWADVLGAERRDHGNDYSYLQPVPGAPFQSLVFVPVPSPRPRRTASTSTSPPRTSSCSSTRAPGCCARRTRRSPGASSPTPTATSSAPSWTDRARSTLGSARNGGGEIVEALDRHGECGVVGHAQDDVVGPGSEVLRQRAGDSRRGIGGPDRYIDDEEFVGAQ